MSAQWYVTAGIERRWFGDDELTARTYVLLMLCLGYKVRKNLFLGREEPPPHVLTRQAKTGSAA